MYFLKWGPIFDIFYSTGKTRKLFKWLVVGFGPKEMPGRGVARGRAEGARAPPEFSRSVNPIQTRGGGLCPSHYCQPPRARIQKAIYISAWYVECATSRIKSEVILTFSIGQWDKIESMPSAFNVSSVPSSFSIVFFNSISPDRVGVFRITSNHDFETMVHFFWRVWKSMKSQILTQTSVGKKGSSTGIEGSGDELAIFYAKLSLQNRLE